MSNYQTDFKEAKCTVCGKIFLPTPDYVYRQVTQEKEDGGKTSKIVFQCSWTCFRKVPKGKRMRVLNDGTTNLYG